MDSVEQVRALFESFDPAGNGSIDIGGLRQLLEHLGVQVDDLWEQRTAEIFNNIDMNGDGEAYYVVNDVIIW